MERKKVQSSQLKSVGYDNENKVLEVEMSDGSIVQYYDVPKREYENLLNAESHGKFFYRYVKEKYQHQQVI
ncbi:MAG: KTSC domain-containing protein [Candidatus Wallbacteria bacterium]|nr:KTSC domain-containing protein [Candidatus Wallbacteria bacterium]